MGMAWQIYSRLFLLTGTREVLFGCRVRVNDSFVDGRGVDLDSVSFSLTISEKSSTEGEKVNQEQSCDFHALPEFPPC